MDAKQPQPETQPRRSVRRLPAALLAGVAGAFGKLSRRSRIAIFVGLLMIGANLALVLTWLNIKPKSDGPTAKEYLAQALAALDRGDYVPAKRLAEHVRELASADAAEAGGASFVLGAATALEADSMWEEDQRRYYVLAARHLDPGVPGHRLRARRGRL